MRCNFRTLAAAFVLVALAGCGTPAAVRELSQTQIAAYDTVITAAMTHHEALIAAARLIVDDRKQRIDTRTKGLADDAAEAIRRQPASAKETVLEYSNVVRDAEKDKARLDRDAQEIGRLSNQLVASLKEMKQAQLALNAYLEQEAVGESFVKSVLGQDSVAGFTQHVTDAINRAASLSEQLKSAIGALKG